MFCIEHLAAMCWLLVCQTLDSVALPLRIHGRRSNGTARWRLDAQLSVANGGTGLSGINQCCVIER
jgi:hypothetical protein